MFGKEGHTESCSKLIIFDLRFFKKKLCLWLNGDLLYKIDQNGNSGDLLSQSQPNALVFNADIPDILRFCSINIISTNIKAPF